MDAWSRTPRTRAALAFATVTAAAWISQASVTLTGGGSGTNRIALLPLSWGSAAVAAIAGGLAAVLVRRGVSGIPLLLLLFLVLPWLPAAIPAAFLMWTGPMTLLLWTAVAVAMLRPLPHARWKPIARPALGAGVIAAVVFSVAAWRVSPLVPDGDEPHYLIITQSILTDGDLRIENNHRRADYRAYARRDLPPDYIRRGRDGEIYSIHAPGLPALLAPAFAIGGYTGALVFVILIASLGSALAWHVGWLRTRSRPAAWFGWAAVTAPATTIFHAFTIYPDGLASVLVLVGGWALLRTEAERESGEPRAASWMLYGSALALLPWLHTRFVILAAALMTVVLLRLSRVRNRLRKSLALIAMPAVSCVCWLGYFQAVYGTPDPRAPYGGELGKFSYIADGLAGLLFDQRYGLLMYAPVLICPLAGLAAMLFQRDSHGLTERKRLAVELLVVIVPYLFAVASYRMWWAGWSAPARFAMPLVLLLAIPAAEAWTLIRRSGTRAAVAGTLVLTGFASCALVFVDRGRLAYNVRTGNSLFLEWLARNADLVTAAPKWAIPSADFFWDTAIWIASALAAWVLLRRIGESADEGHPARMPTATAAVFGAMLMATATVVWSVRRTDGTAPLSAQLQALRELSSSSNVLSLQLQPPSRIRRAGVLSHLRMRLTLDSPAAPDAAALPALPAGVYRVTPRMRGPGGHLLIAIARRNGPFLRREPLTSHPLSIVVNLPVNVDSLAVQTDEAARGPGRATVEPVSLLAAAERLTNHSARHGARYGRTDVFFLDDGCYPEEGAFWVAAGRPASLVLVRERSSGTEHFLVSNGPVQNRFSIQAAEWRREFNLAPDEERIVPVPLDTARGATLITVLSESGFVPSKIDAQSADHRHLGVYVTIVEDPAMR